MQPVKRFVVDLSDPAEIRYLKAMLDREFGTTPHAAANEAAAACEQ